MTKEHQIEYQATHDALTGFPNRALFYDRLSQAISRANRTSKSITLFFLDLDKFKPINDRYGHEAGNSTLKLVTKRLLSCVREMDTVARIGGDEFTIILSEGGGLADAETLAQKIIDCLSEPFSVEQFTGLTVGASIGIAFYPESGSVTFARCLNWSIYGLSTMETRSIRARTQKTGY